MNTLLRIMATIETDHDLLVRMSTKVDLIYTLLSNHLEHHFWYNITMLAALLSLLGGVVMYAVKTRKPQPVEAKQTREGE